MVEILLNSGADVDCVVEVNGYYRHCFEHEHLFMMSLTRRAVHH